MKRFIIQSIAFISIVALILFVFISCTILIVSRTSFMIPQYKHIVVLGDSHTECSVDDTIFIPSINISQGGTAYLFSYVKLKKILEENTHINTVLLSFHYSILVTDNWITSDKFILAKVPVYFFLMNKEEYDIFINKASFWISILKIPARNISAILKFAIKGNISYTDLNIGMYLKLDRNKLQKDIDSKKYQSNELQSYSSYQLRYLIKIANLCKEKNVELILFNAPTYNSAEYGHNDKLLDYYNTYLYGIKYKNYADFSLPEYAYGDIGHLNYKGAEIFSRWLYSDSDLTN